MSSSQGPVSILCFFFGGEDNDKETGRVKKPHPEIPAFLVLKLPVVI